MASLGRKAQTGSVLDVLLLDGQLELHQHAAALAYAKLRRKVQSLGFSQMRDALPTEHARHEAALRLAGFDRFALDRLAVDGIGAVGIEAGAPAWRARPAGQAVPVLGLDRALSLCASFDCQKIAHRFR